MHRAPGPLPSSVVVAQRLRLAVSLALVLSSLPPTAVAAEPAPPNSKVRAHALVVGFGAGGLVGVRSERLECNSSGGWACPPGGYDRSRGIQLSPLVEVTLAYESRGFRFGTGLRYVPVGMFDAGSELQLGFGPGLMEFFDNSVWGMSIDAFGWVLFDFPSAPMSTHRDEALRLCRSANRGDCTFYRRIGAALELDVGLVQKMRGYRLHHRVGYQFVTGFGGDATTGGAEDAPSISASYETRGSRFIARTSFEW